MERIIYYSFNIFIFLTFKSAILDAEKILNSDNEDFDFDGLPGVTYEFKIEVLSGKEQCFFQRIAEGASLHVSFEVLRGGDRLIDFFVDGPNNINIDAQYSQAAGSMEKKTEVGGIHSICLDNTAALSRSFYGSKLVYLYMVTYVMEDWEKYLQEIEGISSAVSNFTHTISSVHISIEEVKQYQAHSRMNVIKDWYLITGNNTYIMYWSILQICIIVCTSGFQVYSVRRLFRVRTMTPTSKPRA